MEDLVYFLGAAVLLIIITVEILMLISYFSLEASISVRSQKLYCTATCPLRACILSIVQR